MLSLYIHIPFCIHKCEYCSFFVLPETDLADGKKDRLEMIKEQYLQQLILENKSWTEQISSQQIKTIYIGGGTPFQLGSERLFTLIDTLLETRDTEFLEELSIEFNPDPMDEVLNFIRKANKEYSKIFKLRYSIGIQSFDDTILEKSGRNYYFNNLIGFFRELKQIKQPHVSYNFDFIAFGGTNNIEKDENGEHVLWNEARREFFEKLVKSHVADGYSLYTLELFPGSARYNKQNLETKKKKTEIKIHPLQGDENAIYDEFILLSDIVERAGYHRYEASNFALRGKRSLHNMVYRNMENYIGIGINSSSYLETKLLSSCGSKFNTVLGSDDTEIKGIRFQNTKHRKSYLAGEWFDSKSIKPLSTPEYMIEKAFLSLRTDMGLKNIKEEWSSLFVEDWEELLALRNTEGIVRRDIEKDKLKLSAKGLDLYNSVITDLFAKI